MCYQTCPRVKTPGSVLLPLIDGPKLFINLGPKPSKALERERPRIVNNFAKRVSRYELLPHPD